MNTCKQLQRKWYFRVKYFASPLFCVWIFYEWKQSMKLLNISFRLVKHLYTNYFATQSDFIYLWCFDLYQRPSSEEACSVLLPVLAKVVMWRGKKSVVHVTQCVAALVPVHITSLLWQELQELNKLLLTKVSDRDRNIKVNKSRVEL